MKLIDKIRTLTGDKVTFRKDIGQHNDFFFKLLNSLGWARGRGTKRELRFDDILHFIKLERNKVTEISKMCVRGHYAKKIRKLTNKFLDFWVDDKTLKEMRNKNPDEIKITELDAKSYVAQLPKKLIEKYGIEHWGREVVTLKELPYSFVHKNKKLYVTDNRWAERPLMRVYIVFGKKYVFAIEKKLGIIDITSEVRGERRYVDAGLKGEIFRGTKEETIAKVKELTGKDWKPNVRETEFMEDG